MNWEEESKLPTGWEDGKIEPLQHFVAGMTKGRPFGRPSCTPRAAAS